MAAQGGLSAGTQFPDVTVHQVGKEMKSGELVKGKKVVFVGVPGAFTPTCHLKHLPSYVDDAAKFQEAGVEVVFVSDPQAELAKALKTDFDLAALGGVRSKRFAAFVDDGIIKYMVVDPGDDSSFAPAMLKVIAEQ